MKTRASWLRAFRESHVEHTALQHGAHKLAHDVGQAQGGAPGRRGAARTMQDQIEQHSETVGRRSPAEGLDSQASSRKVLQSVRAAQ